MFIIFYIVPLFVAMLCLGIVNACGIYYLRKDNHVISIRELFLRGLKIGCFIFVPLPIICLLVTNLSYAWMYIFGMPLTALVNLQYCELPFIIGRNEYLNSNIAICIVIFYFINSLLLSVLYSFLFSNILWKKTELGIKQFIFCGVVIGFITYLLLLLALNLYSRGDVWQPVMMFGAPLSLCVYFITAPQFAYSLCFILNGMFLGALTNTILYYRWRRSLTARK